jgi:hypothetical protein
MKRFALLIVLLALSGLSLAATPWSGVWVLRDNSGYRLTMTLVEAGGGWKVTWKVPVPGAKGGPVTYATMTMETKLDGKVIKSENDFNIASPNGVVGKQVQYWDKQ